MNEMKFKYQKDIPKDQIVTLYESLQWSSARKSDLLLRALKHSHTVVTAWDGEKRVGLGNAISDGHLVVYYPHMVVHPEYQGKGIGTKMMEAMNRIYGSFHQQMVTADGKAIDFYKKCGFEKAGKTESMWIYHGDDH